MKNLLRILPVAASLASTLPQPASAHNQMKMWQGDHGTTVITQHIWKDQDHNDRDEAHRHRLFIGHPWFWDAGLSCYEFGPDCVLVVLNPEQEAYAQERVDAYLDAVRHGLRRAPTHRYVAIETLPLTAGDRCVTVYDTRTRTFVGHGGYTVGGLPPAGSVVRLAAVRAELIV